MKKRKPSRGRGNPAKQRARTAATLDSHKGRKPNSQPAKATRAIAQVAARPGAGAASLSMDDRQSLALLLAPFLIVALSLASQHVLRTLRERAPAFSIATPRTQPVLELSVARPASLAPSAAAPGEGIRVAIAPTLPAIAPEAERSLAMLRRAPAPASPRVDEPAMVAPSVAAETAPPAAAPGPRQDVAALDPALIARPPVAMPAPTRPESPPTAAAPIDPPAVCMARATISSTATPARTPAPHDFGPALARAAQAQLDDLVIYNARYTRIGYPMGDVAPLYGVCTDVVVRAYRALGIDLQELIVATRSGRGDRNIDHRRVEVVRRFFERFGEKLPISDLAEDYRPGDIVTYYRPQNRSSTSHIAIVTEQRAPSGRLMIVHNRGWGPQLEDALFVDQITGHYRFGGMGAQIETAQPASAGASRAASRLETAQRSLLAAVGLPRPPMSLLVAATAAMSVRQPMALCLAPAHEVREQSAAAPTQGPSDLRRLRSASAATRAGTAVTSR